jgi:hypothetical protein
VILFIILMNVQHIHQPWGLKKNNTSNIHIYEFPLMWTCCMSHHPTMLFFSTCQVIEFAWIDVPYILHKCGMSGKCLNTFWSTIELLWTLYQNSPHFTHRYTLSWVPHKNMQPLSMSLWHCMPTLTSSMWLLPHIQCLVMCLVMVPNFVLANLIAHSKCICGPCVLQHSLLIVSLQTWQSWPFIEWDHAHQLLHNVWYGLTLLLQLVPPYLAMFC